MKYNSFTRYIYFILFLLSFSHLMAQENKEELLTEKENLIFQKFQNLLAATTDENKRLINKEISDLLFETLKMEESFNYKFTKLKNLGQITSNDLKVRVYTWNLGFEDGSYEYFGFTQYKESKKPLELSVLTDDSENISKPENAVLSNKNWFGALYYEMIDVKAKDQTYYTLLAWDGNNLFSNKKLIDVLYFTKTGQAKFGYPIFRRNGRFAKRIIFEYGKTASMVLRYDKSLNAIVFDRLVPSKPTFEGNFQFYVPDVTTDGLILNKDSKWDFIEDIQSYNPKNEGLKNRKTEKEVKGKR